MKSENRIDLEALNDFIKHFPSTNGGFIKNRFFLPELTFYILYKIRNSKNERKKGRK